MSTAFGKRGSFVAGKEVWTQLSREVHAPWDGRRLGSIDLATPQEANRATALAASSSSALKAMPAWQRSQMLHEVAESIERHKDQFAAIIVAEAGKPVRMARGEVERAILTFRTAAEEALRIDGHVLPLDWAPGSEGRWAMTRRFPRGPVLAITPFNFPLNLVAHKVAPALAAGCPVVLRPAPQTPFSALLLAEIIYEVGARHGFPTEALSLLHLEDKVTQSLLAQEDYLRQVSFTGSAVVGWSIQQKAGKKTVTLELGGNAAVVVCADWPEITQAAQRAVQAAMGYAGQSCIAVQRVYVEKSIFHRFLQAAVEEAERMVCGDPELEATEVGPVIRSADADRIMQWVKEAQDGGAVLLAGGTCEGSLIRPTLLTATKPGMQVRDEEIFGPVMVIERFEDFSTVLEEVNRSRYGLQAGLLTRDVQRIFMAYQEIEVGGLIVGDMPTWRMDPMPYGGVKDSGVGREGIRSAIEAMTEPRLLVMTQ